jgi:hypothetical protein
MQYARIPFAPARLKIEIETPKIALLPIPEAGKFAHLFTDALTLKIGDGSKTTMGKGGGWGESDKWFVNTK